MKYKPKRRPARRQRTVVLRSKFRQERNHQWARRVTGLLLAAGIGVAGWWGYRSASRFVFCSDCFAIRSIEVKGGKNVTQSEIRALMPFRVGDNLFKIGVSAAEHDIRQCKPELKAISITRRWKSVVVTMQERTPIVAMAVDGVRQGLDEDNVPFPLRGHLAGAPLPVISAAAPDMRREMIRFARALSRDAQDLFPKVEWISLEANDLILGLSGGTKIVWGPMDPAAFAGKLGRMRQVFADGARRFAGVEYVNLSYYDDGRILIKPRVPDPAVKTPVA